IVVVAIATTRLTTQQQASPSEWRHKFRQAALQIPFDKDLPPQRDDTAEVPMNKVPPRLANLRIALARTSDAGQAGRIVSRITSDSGYPRLGIAPGVNYVWSDVVRGRMRLLIIPADTNFKTYWLAVGNGHTHPPNVHVARLVLVRVESTTPTGRGNAEIETVADYCTDWECRPSASWCTARDTVPTGELSLAKPPIDAITQYSGRNKVAWNQH